MMNQISEHHICYIKLWYLVQHSIRSFNYLVQYFGSAEQAVLPKNLSKWAELKLHKNHVKRALVFYTPEEQKKFEIILITLKRHCDFICCIEDDTYPQQLLPYEDKPPILFGEGNLVLLNKPQVAIVGSRKVSKQGAQISYEFACGLGQSDLVITSGLAEGVDAAAHYGALSSTIAVMATGIDRTYPAHHVELRQKIIQHQGTIITEFLPFTAPLKAYFPRRNRIVSGLSLAVVVTEATVKSGSLGTAKCAAEQGKVICVVPSHICSEHNKGGHQLIREGAVLIDHPDQILEEIALPVQWQTQSHQPDIPLHLNEIYLALDWIGQEIEQIVQITAMPIHLINAGLTELEILGLCIQQQGRYLRFKTC
ncbi:DNA-processing protein DprA [Acinetobacter sp. HY1485]|uniref:DNA-processing protein DprA n=1 Tax=Acinetobacter sp. HY1485 TaxID=2970918 RepID=UPI0022B9C2A6|nr:DNA-processing protein DprA [Acinetobacter sp. HY1485]